MVLCKQSSVNNSQSHPCCEGGHILWFRHGWCSSTHPADCHRTLLAFWWSFSESIYCLWIEKQLLSPFSSRKMSSVMLCRHKMCTQNTKEAVDSQCRTFPGHSDWRQNPQSLNRLCWGLFSAFLYKAVFWPRCRYRKQRSAAQGMWSFFLSSSLVRISCKKEPQSLTKKVWPEGRRKQKEVGACLLATLSAHCLCCKACHSLWLHSRVTAEGFRSGVSRGAKEELTLCWALQSAHPL